MARFTLRRFLQAIPTIIGITVIAFFIIYASPGNAATQLTQDPNLTPQQREAIAASMGVNDSFPVQYFRWLVGDAPFTIGDTVIWTGRELPTFDRKGNELPETRVGTARGVLRGDFGNSVVSKKPVWEIFRNYMPATIELGVLSLMIGLLVGIPIGVLAAVNQGSWFDQITRIGSVIISAIPIFWLGMMLLLVFSFELNLLPPGNRMSPTSALTGGVTLTERLHHLILPVFTLASLTIATYSRFMRNSLLDVLNQDYVRTARAKGLGNRRVWFIHALRNALIPIATLLGPSITFVISGAVLTERIYAWPGMGRLLIDSITQQDYPILMAVVILFSIAAVLGFLLSDIFYALLDPRIRLN